MPKQNFWQLLYEKIKRDPAKRQALEYLDEFQGRFWCEAHERVREITEKFEKRIDEARKARFGSAAVGEAGLEGASGTTQTIEMRTELAERYQRVVNETQLARLNKMLAVLDEDILDRPQHFTYVVIDDLDRDWVDERIANDLIRCLFRTVLDLKRVRNLKVVVALRTNIFTQLHFGEKTGGQEEKLRSLVLKMTWTKADLAELVNERMRVAVERARADSLVLADLLPPKNKTRGDAFEYIIDRTLMRPRDAISFLNEIFRVGASKVRASWEDVYASERPYSTNRLLALRDEWKPSFLDIQRVFEVFRRSNASLDPKDFVRKVDEVVLLVADHSFRGVGWLTELSQPLWNSGSGADSWAEYYQPLINFLFRIGFIGCLRSHEHQPTYFYHDQDFAERSSNLESAARFCIHPAFHAALDIRQAGVSYASQYHLSGIGGHR